MNLENAPLDTEQRNNKQSEANGGWKNVVFLHIPKTAGQSLRSVLKSVQNLVDVEHSFAASRRELFMEQDNFSFCFVRNPFTRILSSYFHLVDIHGPVDASEGGFQNRRRLLRDKWGDDFNGFVESGGFEDGQFEHFFPIWKFAAIDGNISHFNFVGRYEELNKDFALLSAMLRIENELPRFNITSGSAYQKFKDSQCWSKAAISAVQEHYSDDFKAFGYSISIEKAFH